MKNILKNKLILIFFLAAAVIVLILGGTAFYSIKYMADTIQSTADSGINGNPAAIRFNFDKLKEIGIIKDF